GGTVYMDCYIKDRMFEVIVRDEGRGIEDVALAMQPFYTSMPNLERSGMGFSVMQAFMDTLHVSSSPGKGTTVSMKKLIPAVSGDE
ncbi:MAG TPA: ATP-binding protein, partial [Clostridia bacterium]|nr:ATP-binding protein [Clostridia bacterium]